MAEKSVDGCPCTASCSNHGDCASCMAAHSGTGEPTACRKLGVPSLADRNVRAVADSVRLLDFSPCAG
ncbi:MAG: hypothetical protein QUS11_12040 [Candidatus Fermentibacter sp.]|nr:hypothetical protein [Candidatus Fermentibacter sp.]